VDDQISELLARKEIEESLLRYARGVDRRDWPAVRACYHDDATDWHGEYRGSADGFIDWVKARHANIPFSMHFIGNCLIEFSDECTAVVETYFVAIQRRETPTADGPVAGIDAEVFGRYCDLFQKRNGAWKVAERQVVYDSTRTQPSSNHLRTIAGAVGRRDLSDPLFLVKKRVS
jgi:3-phenylpropionate/cinnamic acid dioxygenase small subunit